ncbi:hypothetical protein [uncultured Sphingobacterium sp.]|uniref:hypothetical protein n=2 Tax=Bacteroidota TaxID=976 RepID=UPI00095C0D86|nr:hypothetical protein [uncultured Sphingobacterium sp.]OJV16101.1 MAG: hypothetical protein BGO21_30125 [Dyadobacter sp. 50-39]
MATVTMTEQEKNGNLALLDVFVTFYETWSRNRTSSVSAESYKGLVADAVDKLVKKELGFQVSPLAVQEIEAQKPNEKDLLLEDPYHFYSLYTDFVIDVRRKLVRDKIAKQSDYMLEPSASPSVEAYDMVGFNRLNINPSLSSYGTLSSY